MRTELINLLTSYLLGWKTLYDCAEWLAGIDWNDPGLDPGSVELVGRMELLTTEVAEGLRPEAEFWREAAEFVARKTSSFYSRQAFTNDMLGNSASNITDRPPELTVLAGQGLQSWNILPLPVSA